MAKVKKRWIIKNELGNVLGPYSTDEVIAKIHRGEFEGNEYIAVFPSNKWFPISQKPEFYDQLLAALEKEDYFVDEETFEASVRVFKDEQNEKVKQKPEEDITKSKTHKTEKKKQKKSSHKKEKEEDSKRFGKVERIVPEGKKEKAKKEAKEKKKKAKKKEEEVIELKSKKDAVKKVKAKKARLPIVLTGIFLAFALVYILWPSGNSGYVRLIYPKENQTQLPKEQIIAQLKLANKSFMKDTFADYVKAQNYLIKAIEGNDRIAKSYSMLCMTYLQLWPYTNQDSQNLEVLTKIVKKAAKIDAAGSNYQVCNVVNLFVKGQKQEVEGIVDMALESYDGQAEPPTFFYYMKARLFLDNKEFRASLNYLFSAQQIWNQWLHLFVLEAEIKNTLGKYAGAAQRLKEVLKINPNHQAAKVMLGIIELEQLRNIEKGLSLINSGISGSAMMPRATLSKAYLVLAQNEIKNKNDSKAIKFAKKGYAVNPGSSELRKIIISLGGDKELDDTKINSTYLVLEGDQFKRSGDCKAAQAYYKSAFEANNKNGVAAYKAGECLWKLSLRKDAFLWLNKAVLSDPDLIDAYLLLSHYYAENYNFTEAIKVLKRASQQFKRHFKIYRGFANIELKRRNAVGAIHYSQKALEIYDTDVESLIIMAKGYLLQGDVKAYTTAVKAIELESNNRTAQVVYAKTLMKAQGVQSGIDYMIQLVNSYPRIEEYRMGLAEVLMIDQRYAHAERVLKDLAVINDNFNGLHILLADALKGQGNYNQAAREYNKAALLDPTNAETFFKSGLMYLDLNKPKEAQIQFQRAQTMNGDYPLVNYYLGAAYLKMKLPKLALEQAEMEKQKNPNLAAPFTLAADAHLMMKQYQHCVDQYRKAISFGQLSGDFYVKLARCSHLSGNLDMAEDMLTEAKKVESGNPDIYKELGAIYEKKKMPSHAVRAYEVYLKLAPNAADSALIQKRIQSL